MGRFVRLRDGRIFDEMEGKAFDLNKPQNRLFAENYADDEDGQYLRRELRRREDEDRGLWVNVSIEDINKYRQQQQRDRMAAAPKKVEQPKVEATRKAGSLLQDPSVQRALVDAEQYIAARRPELEEFRKSDTQSLGDIEETLLSLSTLRGGVPEPVIRPSSTGGESRLHTRYANNAITGQQQIAPFIDTDTGHVLTTNF